MNRSPQSPAAPRWPPVPRAAAEPGMPLPVAAPGSNPVGDASPPGASPTGPDAPCGHGIGLHDIRTNGKRGACSVFTGPRGKQCECKGGEFQ